MQSKLVLFIKLEKSQSPLFVIAVKKKTIVLVVRVYFYSFTFFKMSIIVFYCRSWEMNFIDIDNNMSLFNNIK